VLRFAQAVPGGPSSLVYPRPKSLTGVLWRSSVGSWLRAYWTALLLLIVAIVLLVWRVPTKEAVTGAGFALLGVALVQLVDRANERRREAAQAHEGRRRDLDETRRLLYMALIVGRTRQDRGAELIGTVVNALVHHQSAVNADQAAVHVAAVIHGGPGGESERWLQGQIDRITAELGP
jgi:hypothetical protein